MATASGHSKLDELVAMLDAACSFEPEPCCEAVKQVLEQVVRSGEDFLDARFLEPAPDRYARRLVHEDPRGRYTVMAMVWGPGQGTPLHDHAGMWCVECVYRGRIEVVSYSLQSEEGDVLAFAPESTVYAGIGEAGKLIPPFDYHTIANVESVPSVTLHVYGGAMTWCNAFVPEGEGRFRRVRRELSYTP